MLEAFFQMVLYMSFSGGVLALVVLCLKAVFRNRIPAYIWLILWLLVAVRLLLPVKIESSLSLFNLDLLQKVEVFITDSGFEEGSRSNRYDILDDIIDERSDAVDDGLLQIHPRNNQTDDHTNEVLIPQGNSATSNASRVDTPLAGPSRDVQITGILPLVWLSGFGICFAFLSSTYLRTWKRISASMPCLSDDILAMVEECSKTLGLRRPVEVYMSDLPGAPCTFGIFKPRLVLPLSFGYSFDGGTDINKGQMQHTMRHIMLHELCHVMRRDNIANLAYLFAACVHWFNPIVWCALFKFRADMEAACDEAVLKRIPDSKLEYGKAILAVAAMYGSRLSLAVHTGASGNKRNIKRRIRLIAEYGKKPLLWVIASVILVVLIGIAGLTSSQSSKVRAERDLLNASGIDEKDVILSISWGDDEDNQIAVFYKSNDEPSSINILIAEKEGNLWQVREKQQLSGEARLSYVTYVYSLGGIRYRGYAGYMNIPEAAEVWASSKDGEIFKDGATLKYISPEKAVFIINQLPDSALPYDIMVIDRNGNVLEHVSGPDTPNGGNTISQNSESSQHTSKPADAKSTTEDLKDRVDKLLEEILENANLKSSNPHDYIKGRKAFDELVSLGYPALQYMFEIFSQSNEDGLKEFIMACACAKIMGIYDEEKGIGISSGREWFYKYGKFEAENDFQIVDADFDLFPRTTIQEKESIILPEGTDKRNLEDVISKYILARNRRAYRAGEKAIEAHKIYRIDEKDGILIAYMQVKFNWFGFENGAFTIVSGIGGEGIPVKMQLKKSDSGEYEVVEYREAMDGGVWERSIREMFPEDLAEQAIGSRWNKKLQQELWNIQVEKAMKYLKQINREDAPVVPYVEKDRQNPIYLVTQMRKDFPDWNGTREVLVRTGGRYPGINIRCILETKCTQTSDEEYEVVLTKTWDIEINGQRPVSYWKYRVIGERVQLEESQNNDRLVLLVR